MGNHILKFKTIKLSYIVTELGYVGSIKSVYHLSSIFNRVKVTPFHWIEFREGVKGKMKNQSRNGVQLCGKSESKRAKQSTYGF